MGKRVLILVQNEPVPSDRHVWNQSRALVRAGYDVTVICPTGETRDRGRSRQLDGVSDPSLRAADRRRAARSTTRSSTWRRCGASAASPAAWRRATLRPRPRVQPAGLPAPRRARAPPAGCPFHLRPSRPDPGALRDTRFGAGPAAPRSRCSPSRSRSAARTSSCRSTTPIAGSRLERGRRDPADVVVVRTGPDLTRFRPTRPDPSLRRGKRLPAQLRRA